VSSVEELIAALRMFDARREIVNAAARGIRKAVAPARKAIKATAKATMPERGHLNIWVSRIGILAQIRLSGRRAGVKLKGGRNSLGGRSDVSAIDRGRVRAPSWGHRNANSWHTVTVTPGFFTRTAAELPDWRDNVDAEADKALDQIRRG
jgi:hypothetical protein